MCGLKSKARHVHRYWFLCTDEEWGIQELFCLRGKRPVFMDVGETKRLQIPKIKNMEHWFDVFSRSVEDLIVGFESFLSLVLLGTIPPAQTIFS